MKTRQIILCGAISLFSYTSETVAQTAMMAKNDSIKPIAVVVPSSFKIGGFINARFQNSIKGFTPGKDGFEFKNAIVDLTGNYCPTINYRLRVEFAGAPQVLDAYAEWKPFKYIGLQVGQFQTPFTFENQYVPKTLETTDNSQVITNLVLNTNGVKNKGRDIGMAINGNLFAMSGYNLLEYKLALLNGNSYNAVDDNSTLNTLGSIYINPIKPLSIVASYLSGKYGPEATKLDMNRKALGIKYDDGKALFRAEYLSGKTNNIDAKGYYAVAGYFITKNIQPIVKYDFYQSNSSISTTGTKQYVLGLNYWTSNKSRILIDYNYSVSNNPTVKDFMYVTAGLVLAF